MKTFRLGDPEMIKAIRDCTQELLAKELAKNPALLRLLNARRAELGVPPLTMSGREQGEDKTDHPPAKPTAEPKTPPTEPNQGH